MMTVELPLEGSVGFDDGIQWKVPEGVVSCHDLRSVMMT